MNKKRLWTRGAAWLLTLCLLAGLCVPTVRAEGELEPTETGVMGVAHVEEKSTNENVAPLAAGTSGTIDLGITGLKIAYDFNNDALTTDKHKATLVGPEKLSDTSLSVGVKSGTYRNRLFYSGYVALTITNVSSIRSELSFEAELLEQYGSAEFNGGNLQASYTGQLEPNESVTFKITSSDDSLGNSNGIKLKLFNITLKPIIVKTTTTFLPAKNGSFKVDDEVVSENAVQKVGESSVAFQLNAEADSGYRFAGWQSIKDGVANFITDENPYVYYPLEDATIQPMFVSKNSATYMVGSRQFFDLNYANAYAVSSGINKIVLTDSGALPKGEYEISKDVTLLIPYSGDTTIHTTEPSTTKNQDAASGWTPYKTLTMQAGAHITVYGAINVDSLVTGNKSEPTGPYGLIQTGEDTSILLKDGANLYCWGFITGDGEVRAQSGASVYECFQLLGWRGGDTSSKMVGNTSKVFPVNKYAVQNVEATLVLEAGAMEKVYASVYLKKTIIITLQDQGAATTDFIGKENGMFRLTAGEISRKYLPAQDRVYYTVNGTLTISKLVLDLSLKTFSMNISLDTQAYVMPLMGNFTIDIKSGTTSIAGVQDLSLMPGAKFIVSEGATFQCSSALFAYDYETYVGKSYAYPNDTVAIPYSPTKGYIRQANINDMPDAEIDVNGTLQVTGTLFTTVELLNNEADPDQKYGANIHSSLGTGKIVFESSADLKRTAVYESKSNAAESYDGIPITPARLRNGDGSYVETSSVKIQNNVAWTYFYDRGATEQWYRFKIQFVMKDNPDVIVYQELVASDTASVKLPGLNGTVTTEIAGGTATSTWDSDSKTLTLTSINPTIPTDGSAPVLKVKVTAAVNSYKPYFVLNEKQYGNYRSYTGKTITDTVDIGGKTYYVVQSSDTLLKFGEKLTGPTDESMGVNDNNHNGITWFLEDTTDGAQVFIGTVPSGETEGGPVYIYGIYSGYEVKVTRNGADEYYTTLKEAVTALPQTGSATVQMLANCGTFEDESKTASYSFIANITFNLNGKEVWGSLVNNGTLTLDLKGGSVVYQTGATAPSSTYRASAPIVNNGTLIIQDTAGGGKITIDAIEDNGSLQNYVSAVRNLGTLTMRGITAETSQTVNDYSAVVLNYNGGVIKTITGCHLIPTRGYGILNYGATITEISGGNIDGGSSSTAGRYGIRNHNLRTGTQQSKDGYSISKEAKIGTIKDVEIYVYQYGIYNFATIDTITGNTNIRTTSSYGINNYAGWYYDTQVQSSTETTSGNVKTTVYTYDTTNFPTIKEISGNTSVTSGNNYALWNAGNIGKISGDLHGTGVRFGRENDNGNYVLQNSGNIGEITGKVTISTNGSYVLSQNLWGTTNARCVSQTYIQKDVNRDGTYTSVGDVREYTYEYNAPVIGTIGGGDSEITISGTSNVFYNFGTVTNIFDGVTITATGSNALVNGTGGGYATWHTVRTNMGYDTVKNRYETRVEEVSERYQAQIGKIIGNVVIEAGSSAITNGGLIEEIGQGVTVKAKSGAIQNTSVTYTSIQRVFLGYDPTYVFGTRGEATNDYAFTADTAEIRKIDGATIQATAGNGAINNGGLIETITNSRISAAGGYAVNNTSNVVTERKIYKDNTLAEEYALTEIFDKFFKKDSSGKYTSVAGRDAPNRIDTYAKVPTITTIGAGNTITAAKQAINNSGEITKIAGTEDSKTSVVATATAKDAMAIYNASALCGKVTVKDGASVSGDYKTAAYIRKLENLNVSAAGYGIQNGTDNGSYLNVIDEIGVGVVVTSKNSNAVYNAPKNAQIKSISGGVYTAQTSGQCAVNNANTTYAIAISDGSFKGGTSDRVHAISDPDNTARQTYPTGYTLSGVTRSVTVNDTAADGYYFVTKNEFTIVFDGNPATVSGSVASMTVSRTATSVTLPSSGFTRDGFEQVGWALTADTGADSGDLLGLGATVTLAQLGNPTAGAEVKLYAVWKPTKTYNITVTWNGDLSYTYTPAVYRWNGATMKYQLESAACWTSALGTGNWPSVTVKNAGTDSTKEGTVAVEIAYTRATNYNALNMEFTVGDATTTDSATLSSQLSLRQSASATMKLTGTPPNETANSKVVGSVKLTLTPTDG